MEIDKTQLIEALKYNLETMAKFAGADNHKIKIDYENERLVCTKGILFKTLVSDKSFDQTISEFLNKLY